MSRRIAIIASASGSGKTTLARQVARALELTHVELDALVHGPNWQEAPTDDVLTRLGPMLDRDGWVVDGNYLSKLGAVVLERADEVVWLDLPRRVWLPRLARRTVSRMIREEVLWNGNRESLGNAIRGRDSLFLFALRTHRARRRDYPQRLATFPVTRLTTQRAVDEWYSRTIATPTRLAG